PPARCPRSGPSRDPARSGRAARRPSGCGRRCGRTRTAPRAQPRSYELTLITSIDICRSMSINLELIPKTKRAAGEPCCEPVVYPDVERQQAERMATIAKALGDPIRLQLVDVLRKHAGKVCVCELVPLFDISQPTLSHHLKKL